MLACICDEPGSSMTACPVLTLMVGVCLYYLRSGHANLNLKRTFIFTYASRVQ